MKETHMDDKTRHDAEDLLYADLLHDREGKVKWIAGIVAVIIHLVVIFVPIPEVKADIQKK